MLLEAKKQAESQLTGIKSELETAKYITPEQPDVVQGLKALLKEKGTSGEALSEAVARLTKEKYIDDSQPSVAKGVEKLLSDKAAVAQKLSQTSEQLAARDKTLESAKKRLIDAKYLDANAGNEDLAKGLDQALSQGQSPLLSAVSNIVSTVGPGSAHAAARVGQLMDQSTRLTAQQIELARMHVMLQNSRTPSQMLPVWQGLLQDRTRTDLAERALIDAQSVSKEPAADARMKAMALYTEGLALRNLGKYAEARMALQSALAADPGADREAIQRTLNELANPSAYFIPAADSYWRAGDITRALGAVDGGLTLFPRGSKESASLLALRSLLLLDAKRAKGPVKADDPQLLEAKNDASAAIAAGAVADGNYAMGRIEEVSGHQSAAVKYYREAIAKAAGKDSESRYVLALARALVGMSGSAPVEKPATQPTEKPASKPAEKTKPDATEEKKQEPTKDS